MDVDEIGATLEVLRLMAKYERYYDTKVLDPLVELFHEDCTVDYDVFGRLDGREEVREFLEAYHAGETEVKDCFHMLANPWIEVDGDEAIGRWHFFGAYTLRSAGACWLVAFYDISFTKIHDAWSIEELDWEAKYVTPYEDGWEETPMAL